MMYMICVQSASLPVRRELVLMFFASSLMLRFHSAAKQRQHVAGNHQPTF